MFSEGVTLSVLILVTSICVVVLTVFVCKFVISLTRLTDNANIIATNVQQEIEPTLKELKEAAKSINSIANNADTKFQNTKTNIASIIGATACLGGKLKSFSQGIMKGLSFGLGLFKK